MTAKSIIGDTRDVVRNMPDAAFQRLTQHMGDE